MSLRLARAIHRAGVASRRKCDALIASGAVAVNGAVVTDPTHNVQLVGGAPDVVTVGGAKVGLDDLAAAVGNAEDATEQVGASSACPLPPQEGAQATQNAFYYVLLNKPEGYVCSTIAQTRGQRSVFDLPSVRAITGTPPQAFARTASASAIAFSAATAARSVADRSFVRLWTVGRLDADTSGLLLLTNDGAFTQRATHPSAGVEKEYVALTQTRATPARLAALAKGAPVEGRHVVPARVLGGSEWPRRASDAAGVAAWNTAEAYMREAAEADRLPSRDRIVAVTLVDGRKRAVRRLLDAAGLGVERLLRTRVGGMTLPASLAVGQALLLGSENASIVFEKPGGRKRRRRQSQGERRVPRRNTKRPR